MPSFRQVEKYLYLCRQLFHKGYLQRLEISLEFSDSKKIEYHHSFFNTYDRNTYIHFSIGSHLFRSKSNSPH